MEEYKKLRTTNCLYAPQSSLFMLPRKALSVSFSWSTTGKLVHPADCESRGRSRPSRAVHTSRLLVLLPYCPIDRPLSFTKSAALGKEDERPRACPDPSPLPNEAGRRSGAEFGAARPGVGLREFGRAAPDGTARFAGQGYPHCPSPPSRGLCS